MIQDKNKYGTTTMQEAVTQRLHDLYVLKMMKDLERSKLKSRKHKMMTIKVGKSTITAQPYRIIEMLEYKGYDKQTINQLMEQHGYKQS